MKMGNLDFPYTYVYIYINIATQIEYARTETLLRQRSSAFQIYFTRVTGKLCTQAARLRVHGNRLYILREWRKWESSRTLQHPASRTTFWNPFLSFTPTYSYVYGSSIYNYSGIYTHSLIATKFQLFPHIIHISLVLWIGCTLLELAQMWIAFYFFFMRTHFSDDDVLPLVNKNTNTYRFCRQRERNRVNFDSVMGEEKISYNFRQHH